MHEHFPLPTFSSKLQNPLSLLDLVDRLSVNEKSCIDLAFMENLGKFSLRPFLLALRDFLSVSLIFLVLPLTGATIKSLLSLSKKRIWFLSKNNEYFGRG